MPRASAADAARTARDVLAAAVRRFSIDGYAGTTLDGVAQEAGVTRGAVYHHYRDKRGLLHAAVLEGHARVAQYVVQEAERESSALDQLRAGCHAFVEGIVSDDAARLILIDGPAVFGWAAWRELDAAASVAELREAVASVSAEDDVEATTQILSGAMNEAALWLIERPEDECARAAVRRGIDRLVDSVSAR